jgi:hypothetical protein
MANQVSGTSLFSQVTSRIPTIPKGSVTDSGAISHTLGYPCRRSLQAIPKLECSVYGFLALVQFQQREGSWQRQQRADIGAMVMLAGGSTTIEPYPVQPRTSGRLCVDVLPVPNIDGLGRGHAH